MIGIALLLAACGLPGEEPWARSAEEWFAGLDAALEDQDHGHVLYYAPDAVLDSFDYSIDGRWPIAMLQAGLYGVEQVHGPLYLGRDAAVRTDIIMGDRPDIRLAHAEVTDAGIQRYTHLLHSQYLHTVRHRQADAMALADRLAADYLRAWGSADPSEVQQLYASDATLVDDLHGLSVEGGGAIAELADSSVPWVAQDNGEVLPQSVLDLAPEVVPDAPAVFVTFELDRAELPTQVWLMVRSEAPCPGAAAVALDVDEQQRITAERRFSSVASIRGCVEASDALQGWWTGRGLPQPFGERVTGSVDTGAGTVEVRNSWPPSDDAVRWAFGRFEAAGLPPPVVTAIAFDPLADGCGEFSGYAEWHEGTTEILICFDSSRIGQPSGDDGRRLPPASNLLLHELGHAWVVNHADDATRAELVELLGLGTWDDRGEPWRERGVEWAAEALAWGLHGRAATSVPLGSPDCSMLADGFRILTGTEPLSDCPADGTADPGGGDNGVPRALTRSGVPPARAERRPEWASAPPGGPESGIPSPWAHFLSSN